MFTDLFSSFETRDRSPNLVSQSASMRGVLFVELVSYGRHFFNGACNAEPYICFGTKSIVFSVKTEMGIFETLNEPVISLVSISSPWLNR